MICTKCKQSVEEVTPVKIRGRYIVLCNGCEFNYSNDVDEGIDEMKAEIHEANET